MSKMDENDENYAGCEVRRNFKHFGLGLGQADLHVCLAPTRCTDFKKFDQGKIDDFSVRHECGSWHVEISNTSAPPPPPPFPHVRFFRDISLVSKSSTMFLSTFSLSPKG
jgi:hypothetical protein